VAGFQRTRLSSIKRKTERGRRKRFTVISQAWSAKNEIGNLILYLK